VSETYFTLKSDYDGLPLSVVSVRPDGPVRAVVQLVHGMCEHKGRYLPFMHYLAGKGCLCVMNDHRGHGGSVLRKEDLGYFYEAGDTALVEDLHQITRLLRSQHPDLPLILFGHSMGSLAVRAYADCYDGEIDGLIVCGSPGDNPAAGAGLMLIGLLSRIFGERHRSELIYGMTTGAFARRFPDARHPSAWLSVNEANVTAFEGDPLCGFRFTLNGNRALLRLMQRAYKLSPRRNRPDLPVRFYSGADDPCAPDRRGFDRALASMRKAGFRDVQGRMFDGLRHEILNETESEMIYEIMFTEAVAPHMDH